MARIAMGIAATVVLWAGAAGTAQAGLLKSTLKGVLPSLVAAQSCAQAPEGAKDCRVAGLVGCSQNSTGTLTTCGVGAVGCEENTYRDARERNDYVSCGLNVGDTLILECNDGYRYGRNPNDRQDCLLVLPVPGVAPKVIPLP